jgi:hypothetical protein
MPEGLVALLPALIGAGTAGTEIGLQASGALSPGSSGPSAADQQKLLQEANQKSQQTQEQMAFKNAAPDAQTQTGGALADSSFASMVASLTGAPSDVNLAQNTIFGNTPGLSSGGGGGT